MIVFLWTDIFLWLLLFLVSFTIYKLKSRPDMKQAMKQLSMSKSAILSGIILSFYIVVGLLDSIHFRYEVINPNTANDSNITAQYGDVISLLDYFAEPWSQLSEKTFSAPFSDVLYTKERLVTADGNFIEAYPLLEHVKPLGITNLSIYIFIIILFISIISGVLYYFYHKLQSGTIKDSLHNRSCNTDERDFISDLNSNSLFKYALIRLLFLVIICSITVCLYKNYHVLGTDKIGQDILYITLKSIRTGLVIGSLTTIFMLPLALLFGTSAGYFGGKIDDVIQYIYITLSSIPGVLLISALILIIQTQIALHPNWFETIAEQADIRLLFLCIILGITSWSGLCRLLRAETLKLKQMDYVVAAKTMHVSDLRIIIRHIIPNLVHLIIINIAMGFSGLVLAEAVLSYIGVGVDPTTMSWGNMINSARLELSRDPIVWWPILGAFIPMFTFVLALNIFADKLRDVFDPRIRTK